MVMLQLILTNVEINEEVKFSLQRTQSGNSYYKQQSKIPMINSPKCSKEMKIKQFSRISINS